MPAVIVATLVVPPLGAALAFMARWGKTGKVLTVVLASVWFVVLVAADGDTRAPEDAKAGPAPVATVTATATATATVTATPPAASAAPSPAATATASPTSPRAATSPSAPERVPTAARPRLPEPPPAPPADRNGPVQDPDDAPAGPPPSGGGSVREDSGAVSYRNCTAVREAGAAPIRRGDPGYGRHLDRDGDGVGCE
ncbi:excalibur calcium-binding domain-containing protein [Streptomyces sp. W1SF4]|uniref:excalibur calcium-binding domain-containing protein n=1 Tax=Streptomyces sp. W1SF4 TaxID=2305220 RepID=UPI001F498F1D|nr:excalibur calcium-binding domain-containing protein [Streptomyces sp. W1SF4]